MNLLSTREAYRLWAPTYAAETAVSFIDERLAGELSPPLDGTCLLDAGCGTGRRLPRQPRLAVGIDASPEMLAAGGAARVAAADVCALPFADSQFDVAWCRLVLGHLAGAAPAYRELARICRPGGHLLVSDFHSDAVAAGHRRRLSDAAGTVHDVEHHVHGEAGHHAMAAATGLKLVAQRDGVIDSSVQAFYLHAGRDAAFERDVGLAVVVAFLFRRG